MNFRKKNQFSFCAVILFLTLNCLVAPSPVKAAEDTVQPEQTFPGFNEVIPKATATAARITDAKAQVQQATQLDDVYAKLDEKVERLKNLEELYSPWEDAGTWQFNRLLSARINYNDLIEQQNAPLEAINVHLKNLEELRNTWNQQEAYWQGWQDSLRKTDVKLPRETFSRTLSDIRELLQKITNIGGKLIKAQQKYSPARELAVSRLSMLNKTIENLRFDSFQRNAYSLFEADYYSQFKQKLFTSFTQGLTSNIRLPEEFFKRHLWVLVLQFITIVTILLLLVYRKRQSEDLTEEWAFLYRRPLSGAVFMTLVVTDFIGSPYSNAPLSWLLLIAIVLVIAGVRLLDAIYPERLTRRVIRFIATFFIVTETFRVLGLPTPLMQVFQVLLCLTVITACWLLIRRQGRESKKIWFGIYPGCCVAVIGLVMATLGFATLTTNLIVATLSSYIVIILLKMALRLTNGGIQAFMSAAWVKERSFMQTLGAAEATQKLQYLVRVIILVNTGLYFLVIWQIFDDLAEAHETFLSYEYSFGEFTFSVEMVVMVVVVLYLTTLISWVIQAFVESQIMTPRKMDIGVKESLKRLTHYGLFTIGFMVAISMAGIDLQKFTIMAGALGVGIGFGLQNIVNNFVSGLILLFERPVKVGDTINIDQNWGTIKRIGLRSTIFETFDHSEIIVPNADLVAQKVTNWTYTTKMVRVVLPVGVSYGSSLEQVLGILNRAAREHPDVLEHPGPDTVFEGFGNSSIDFKLRFWVQSIDDRMRIRTGVAMIIDRLFREVGITIPFPQQDLHLKSINSKLQPLFGAEALQTRTEPEDTPE